MKFKRGRPALLLLAGLFLFFTSTDCHAQASDSEFKVWTNAAGNKITAKAIGYDTKTRTVKWLLRNQAHASSTFASLSPESRKALLTEKAFQKLIPENIHRYEWRKIPKSGLITATILAAFLLLILFVTDFFAFKLSARILASTHYDLQVYLRLTGIQITAFLPSVVISSMITENSVSFVANAGNMALSIMLGIIQIVATVLQFHTIMSHYGIGIIQTLVFSLLRSIFLGIFLVVVIPASLLFLALLSSVPWTGLNVVDNIIYHPLGLM